MSEQRVPTHRGCSYILPDSKKWLDRRESSELYANAARWLKERTHGCWCSSWRLNGDQWSIWRDGEWQKPHRGEFYMAVNRMAE